MRLSLSFLRAALVYFVTRRPRPAYRNWLCFLSSIGFQPRPWY